MKFPIRYKVDLQDLDRVATLLEDKISFYKENRPYDPKIERLEIAHKEVVELVDDIDW